MSHNPNYVISSLSELQMNKYEAVLIPLCRIIYIPIQVTYIKDTNGRDVEIVHV
jgi:hypothetical protein